MGSRIFSYKKELMKQSFRSTGWIGIAYLLVLLLVLPIRVLMELSNEEFRLGLAQEEMWEHTDIFLSLGSAFQVLFIVIFSVLAGIFVSHYMHAKGSSDFMHSLPLKRSTIFIHQLVMGYIQLLVPVVLTGLILLALLNIDQVDIIYQSGDIFRWFYYTMTFQTLFFACSLFIGHLTGNSIVQGALTYITLFFPAGIIFLLQSNLALLLIGYSDSFTPDALMYRLSPIIWLIDNMYGVSDGWTLWYYWIVALVFIVVAALLYQIRPAEVTQQAFAFPIIKPIFKFGVTFCMMLLGGMYFAVIQGASLSWLTVGYGLGAVIGYVLAEMLIQKTWRVFAKWRGFVVYIGISIILLLSVVFDWYGFESKIPIADQVEGVMINTGEMGSRYYLNEEYDSDYFVEDHQSIQDTISLHQELLDRNRHSTFDGIFYSNNVTLTYLLSNGQQMTREYTMDDITTLDPYLERMAQHDNFKKAIYPWLFEEGITFRSVYLYGYQQSQEITSPEMIDKLVEAYRQDVLDMDYQMLRRADVQSTLSIEFQLHDGTSIGHGVPVNFRHVIELLQEENMDDLIQVNEDDVRMIAITDETGDPEDFYAFPFQDVPGNWLRVTDGQDISELMDLNANQDGDRWIGFYGRENELLYTIPIDSSQLPAHISSQLESP
ncbi:DUF6449 domain-containing protein [Gracilibacillus timonensis]|uniref:DUF6449 domain-containing protein n=1 Tax=Gracilibacillus timonensis TaxID=1816696 RepID=UPI0008246C18|nr:DUF6449 domain-containing protein [Gracilibacillus timonensis]